MSAKRYEIRHRCPLCGDLINDVSFISDFFNEEYHKRNRKDRFAIYLLNHYLDKHPNNTNETTEEISANFGG